MNNETTPETSLENIITEIQQSASNRITENEDEIGNRVNIAASEGNFVGMVLFCDRMIDVFEKLLNTSNCSKSLSSNWEERIEFYKDARKQLTLHFEP